ncbi:MAG: hypothetical protein LBB77_04350 [Treponema sp.]|nr:hypothetical protein [Treponema sp.]
MEKPGMGRHTLFRAGLLSGFLVFRILPCLSAQSSGPYWKDPPASLTAGQEARLALCFSGGKGPPVLPPVPSMVIMEALPPEEDEFLAFRVIPLEGPFFILPAFSLSPDPGAPAAPPLRIPVNSAPPQSLPAAEGEVPAGPAPGKLPPFPPAPIKRGWSRKVLERSRAFWEGGQPVEALAELRRHERDHIAGFSLAPRRRELERALRLEGEEDEVFRHPLFLIPAAVFCLILAALSITLPAGLRRRLGRRFIRWVSRGLSLVFSVLALLCLLRLTTLRSLESSLPVYLRGRSPLQALARETPVYQVPEDGGTRIASLREGQGLLIYEVPGGWAYAESLWDGIAGWIKTGSYLVY